MLTHKFFDHIRKHAPGGQLLQRQVEGLQRIEEGWLKYAGPNVSNIQLLAYTFATAARETGWQFRPVKETQKPSEDSITNTQVKTRLTRSWKDGKLPWVKKDYWSGGWFGRGLVQLTHEANYKGPARKAVLEAFGVDIHKDPDLLLRMDISVFILIKGSLEGWFTGAAFTKFIDDLDEDDEEDYREFLAARRTINGQDAAEEIARTALVFEQALKEGWQKSTSIPAMPVGGEKTQPERVSSRDGQHSAGAVAFWLAAVVIVAATIAGAVLTLFK